MSHSRTVRPACPFVAGPKIEDSSCFVGRKEELRLLTNWMSGSQPLSVNVVGERLSGKSSLLQHFVHFYAQRVPNPSRFLVVFISLRLTKPTTEAEFYQTLAKALPSTLPANQQNESLRSTLASFSGGCSDFAALLESFAERSLLPVFCLDEFEKLFDHLKELNKDFYDRLRGLMSTNKLMLIIATRERLKVYGEEHQLESAFFNLGQLCELKDFSDEEVNKLLLLPNPARPALDMEERQLAKDWGDRQPHRLQLAGQVLFEAKRDGKNTDWAKQRFKAQLEETRLNKLSWRRIKRDSMQYSQSLRDALAEDKCKKALVTTLLILAVVGGVYALLTGKEQLSVVLDWLIKLIPK